MNLKTILIFGLAILFPTVGSARAYQSKYITKTGSINAVVRITNSKSKDDLLLLEGTILELGPSKCTVLKGKCTFNNLRPTLHIASVLYDPRASGIDFKFIGTKDGPIVNLKFDKEMKNLLTPGKEDFVTYKFEKIIDPSIQIAEDNSRRYQGPDGPLIDTSLTAEIWLKIIDTRESKPFVRKAYNELTGTRIRMGDQICTIKEDTCKFNFVGKGQFKVSIIDLPAHLDRNSIKVSEESEVVEIVVDEWTKRPRPKYYSGDLRLIIEKTIQ